LRLSPEAFVHEHFHDRKIRSEGLVRENPVLKTTLIAIGGGGLSAAASMAGLFGSAGGFVLAYLAPLPLLVIGLSLGPAACLVAAVTGISAVALLGGLSSASIYGGMHAVPSWLIVRHALAHQLTEEGSVTEWQPVGTILAWLAVLGAVAATAMALAGRGDAGIEASISEMLRAATALAAPSLPEDQQEMFATYLAPMFIGMSAFTWIVMLVINGILAQRLMVSKGWNIRPTPRWSDLQLPDWLSWFLVAAAAAAVFGSGDVDYLANNLVIIFATPYFFLGLAVVHSFARTSALRGIVLAAFYVTLILFLLFAGAILAGLGVIEQWVGIRRRFAKANPPKGSE
jgi:MFS family permease